MVWIALFKLRSPPRLSPDHVRDHNGHREEHGDGKNGAEHGEMVAKEADQGRPG